MDDVRRLPLTDRTDLFAAVARQRGLTPAIIERDFSGLLDVKRLFTLPDCLPIYCSRRHVSVQGIRAYRTVFGNVDCHWTGPGWDSEARAIPSMPLPVRNGSSPSKRWRKHANERSAELLTEINGLFSHTFGDLPSTSGDWNLRAMTGRPELSFPLPNEERVEPPTNQPTLGPLCDGDRSAAPTTGPRSRPR